MRTFGCCRVTSVGYKHFLAIYTVTRHFSNYFSKHSYRSLQTKFAKVMFSQTSVILSIGEGVSIQGVCIQEGSASRRDLHPGGYASGGLHPEEGGWADTPGKLQDTVSKRAVRIILECIFIMPCCLHCSTVLKKNGKLRTKVHVIGEILYELAITIHCLSVHYPLQF